VFDLSAATEEYVRSRRWRVWSRGGVAIGLGVFIIALIGFGSVLGWQHPTESQSVVDGILAAMGAAFIWTGVSLPRGLRATPNRLALSAQGVELGRLGADAGRRIAWSGSGARFRLWDGRALQERLGRPSRSPDLLLVLTDFWGTQIPLTEEAFDAILDESERQGMRRAESDMAGIDVTELSAPRTTR
jgi:hypothetical protein